MLLSFIIKTDLIKNKEKYNERIISIQSFMDKYNYYNNDEYKYFYPELINYSKLDLMVHWHTKGIKENKYCSLSYFKKRKFFKLTQCSKYGNR